MTMGWRAMGVATAVAVCLIAPPGRRLGADFIGSLRIAKPTPVTVSIPTAGPAATHQIETTLTALIADSEHVTLTEGDRPAPNIGAAAAVAGFAAHLPAARRDTPTVIVTGAREVSVVVDRSLLATMLAEAGERQITLPPDLGGALATIHLPRAIRAEYGHCPQPAAATLQGQFQGPPPPSTTNADCLVLTEGAAAEAHVPASLDMSQLIRLSLELAGMNPAQTAQFQRRFEWRAILALSLPRFVRSYDSVLVRTAPGMLFTSGGRRGPAYTLIWTRGGLVYSLTGYGNAAEAVPLAASIN